MDLAAFSAAAVAPLAMRARLVLSVVVVAEAAKAAAEAATAAAVSCAVFLAAVTALVLAATAGVGEELELAEVAGGLVAGDTVAAEALIVEGLRLGPRARVKWPNFGETSAASSAALGETVEELVGFTTSEEAGVDVVVRFGEGGGLTAGRAGLALTVTVFVSPVDLFLTITSYSTISILNNEYIDVRRLSKRARTGLGTSSV